MIFVACLCRPKSKEGFIVKQQYQSPEVEITPIYNTSNVFTESGDGSFDLDEDTP